MSEQPSPSSVTPDSTATRQLLQKVGAEFVGTFALLFVGCGAIMVNAGWGGGLGHVGVCLAFGLVIMVMIYATGHISGAHFNPAVTVAFASIGRFPWKQVPAYIVGQVLAALLAVATLKIVLGEVADFGATVPAVGLSSAFVMELILTFFLMFVITAVATDSRAEGAMAGLAIGGTVALAALFGGPISGASMNPARSLGPAIISGQFEHIWLYLSAPVVGAILGAWVYRWIQCDSAAAPSDAEGCC